MIPPNIIIQSLLHSFIRSTGIPHRDINKPTSGTWKCDNHNHSFFFPSLGTLSLILNGTLITFIHFFTWFRYFFVSFFIVYFRFLSFKRLYIYYPYQAEILSCFLFYSILISSRYFLFFYYVHMSTVLDMRALQVPFEIRKDEWTTHSQTWWRMWVTLNKALF